MVRYRGLYILPNWGLCPFRFTKIRTLDVCWQMFLHRQQDFGRRGANRFTVVGGFGDDVPMWLKIESKNCKRKKDLEVQRSIFAHLCPLVGSGILYMDHPKDQPLCLVDWTSWESIGGGF